MDPPTLGRTLLSGTGLAATVVRKLLDADFVYNDDLQGMQPVALSQATGLSLRESAEVIRLVEATSAASATSQQSHLQPVTVLQMVQAEREVSSVVTFSRALDEVLGGGVSLRTLTELAGCPGIGKTQLCLQLCVSVQIPVSAGGVDGEAVYIDTEGSFTVGRLKDMASSASEHVKVFAKDADQFTAEDILKRVHYFRCHSCIEVLATIHHLPRFLQLHTKVRLIIIDSVAFHFRYNFPDPVARTGILCRMTQDLVQLAVKHDLAVVLTNQMTTRFDDEGGGMPQLVPALGETWGHCPTVRLVLHWHHKRRAAQLLKAPHRPNATAFFQITHSGIRDLPDGSASQEVQQQEKKEEPSGTKKRKLEDQ
ncbi:DNA repair protein RAD51 homolog 3-like isoform X2 [Oratosquilla oratoria]